MKSDVPGGFIAAGRARNMNRLLVGADDLKSRRLRVDNQHEPRLQRVTHSLVAKDLCLGESGDITGDESYARSATE